MDIRKWILRLLHQGKLTDEDKDEARREFEDDRRELQNDRRQVSMGGGFLKREQLEEAERVMRETKQTDIGRVLVSLGMVGERELLMARAQEMNLGFVDLDRVSVDPDAIACVPESVVKDHRIMPIKRSGMTLWLAMSNDKNILALDDVKMASGCRVIPVLALPEAIGAAITKHYGDSPTPD